MQASGDLGDVSVVGRGLRMHETHRNRGGLGRAEQGGWARAHRAGARELRSRGLARRRSWGVAESCDVAAESTTATRVGRCAPW